MLLFSFSFFVVCQDHVRMEVNFSLEGGLGVRGITKIRALIASFHWFVLGFCEIRGDLIIVSVVLVHGTCSLSTVSTVQNHFN